MTAGSLEPSDGQLPVATPAPAGDSWALPRGVVVLLGAGGAVLAITGIRTFSDIIGPVFLALVLTIAVSPLRRLLVRRGVRTWLAALIALVTVIAFLLGMAAAVAYSVAKLATLLPTYQDKFAELVDDARGWLADHGVGEQQLQAALEKLDLGKFFDLLQSLLSGLVGTLSDLSFVVIVLFFMALDATQFPDRLREAGRDRPDIINALSGFARGTTRYLIVCTVFGFVVAAIDVGVLYLLDIPLPWLWGLLAFITNYIPNVGFFIGVVPPALLGLLDQGVATMLWVIAAYCVINFIIQSIIQPKVVGDAVGLSTTLSFLSLIVWAWILGPVGAVLAIPASLLVKAVLVDADPATRWLGGLISLEPLPEHAEDNDPAETSADLPPVENTGERVVG